jgi:hypothetical protein
MPWPNSADDNDESYESLKGISSQKDSGMALADSREKSGEYQVCLTNSYALPKGVRVC